MFVPLLKEAKAISVRPQPYFNSKHMGYRYYFYASLLLWYGYIVLVSLLAVKHLLSLSSVLLLFFYFKGC